MDQELLLTVVHKTEIDKSNNMSGEPPDDCAGQEPVGKDVNNIPTRTPSDNNNPTARTSIDRHPGPLSEPTAVTSMTNTPVDVIADESNALHHPKWVIKPRIQSDEAAMDDSDCMNSDCKDPKQPGKFLKCGGLGCQIKVGTCFVDVHFACVD